MRYDTKFCVFCHWSYFKNWRAEGFHMWLSEQVHSEWQPWVKQQSEWIGIKMGTQQCLIQCSFPLLSVRSLSVHLIWWSRFCNCFLGHTSEWNPCLLPRQMLSRKVYFLSWLSKWYLSFLQKKSWKFHWTYFFQSFWHQNSNISVLGKKEGRWDRKWKHNLVEINHGKYCQSNRQGFCRTQ